MKPETADRTERNIKSLNDLGERITDRLDDQPTLLTNIKGLSFGLFYGFFLMYLIQGSQIMGIQPRILVQLIFLSPAILFFIVQYEKGKRATKLFFAGLMIAFLLITMLPPLVMLFL